MRRQEELDNEKDEPERDDEMSNIELEDEIDEDEALEDEDTGVRQPQRGEIEHGEKSRYGDVTETDDRVAWTEDDVERPDGADRR
jgi:hypothetical protein